MDILYEVNKILQDGGYQGLNDLLVLNVEEGRGDVSLPCFSLAKQLHKSPVQIAEDIKSTISSDKIDKMEVVNGYLNFYLNKEWITNNILQEVISAGDDYGKTNIGAGKTAVFDYSSVNLAKYMHIGHLKTTIIGDVMKNLYKFFGYNTVGINYVGDYGTPFGKMIVAYKHWGSKQDVEARQVDAIQDLYVKFNQEVLNDPSLEDQARQTSLLIEKKNPQTMEIYNWFIDLSKKEVKRLCDKLGIYFDSWRGEAYYSDKMGSIIDELNKRHLLITSEGAKGVDLSEYGLGFCLIARSDGASLYVTRDLAAAEDRYKEYHFDKCLYFTDVSQKLHFEQLFKVLELLDKPYANGMKHVFYGRYSLPTGKIASRMGKQALIRDIYDNTYQEAQRVINERGTIADNKDEVADKITVGALKFETVKTELIKDSVFNPDKALSFEGETSPYMQYTYARTCSILENCKSKPYSQTVSVIDQQTFSIVKHLATFNKTLRAMFDKNEPYLLTSYLLDLCSYFNKFYNTYRVIENDQVNKLRKEIVAAVKVVLQNGLNIIGIPLIEKM